MPVTIDGSNGITTPTYGGADTSEYLVPVTGFKNRIINGNMSIDQRNAGASMNNPNGYTVDRFTVDKVNFYAPTSCTVQRSSVAPTGFRNSLGFTITTGASAPGAADAYRLTQSIEGFNTADFNYGTANAVTTTLSFWVRSSVTGTYAVSYRNGAGNRSYVTSYVINSANTWEQKSLAIPGCLDGTWGTTNDSGIDVIWDLGVGSNYQTTANTWANGNFYGLSGTVKLATQTGATFYITGVQLEVGSTATSFDYRPYGTELALCQRYFNKLGGSVVYEVIANGFATSTGGAEFFYYTPATMRSAPSLSYSTLLVADGTGNNSSVTALATDAGQNSSRIVFIQPNASGLTTYRPYKLLTNNSTSGYLFISAEL